MQYRSTKDIFEHLKHEYINERDLSILGIKPNKFPNDKWYRNLRIFIEQHQKIPMKINTFNFYDELVDENYFHVYMILVLLMKKYPDKVIKLIMDTHSTNEISDFLLTTLSDINEESINIPTEHKHVYIIHDIDSDIYKIGISKNIKTRLSNLDTSNPHNLKIYKTYKLKNAKGMEKQLHKQYEHLNVKGEWFKLSEEDLINIDRILTKYIQLSNEGE